MKISLSFPKCLFLISLTLPLSIKATDIRGLSKKHNLSNTKDPYQKIWQKHEGKVAGMKRFFVDLNDDGKKELFLGANSLYGNGGGIFYIFQQKNLGYKSLGQVFIDLNNFEVSDEKVNGFRIIKSFNKNGLSLGNLNYYQLIEDGYKKTKSEKHDPERKIKLINQTNIQPEDSGDILKWRP